MTNQPQSVSIVRGDIVTEYTGNLTRTVLHCQHDSSSLRAFQGEVIMKRREFCRQLSLAGGALVLAPLMSSCAPKAAPSATAEGQMPTTAAPTASHTAFPTQKPASTATTAAEPTRSSHQPTESSPDASTPIPPTEEPNVARIALVRTGDRAQGVRQAMELLALNPIRGNRVLLKANYNSADAAPASTHPDILRALVMEMNEMGARSITLGERSGMGDTRAVLEHTGVFGLADELGFDSVVFDELDEVEWTVQRSDEFHWSSGFAVPKMLLDSECVVQTCNLKTHSYGGHFTLSLKNSVGFVARSVYAGSHNYMGELHSSPYQRQMIAEINTVYTPSLIVMDGVEAFVDGGPASGKKVSPSVVLAGTDPVAMDAVGVAILRLFGTTPQVSEGKVFEQEQIARAVELGLGVDSPDRIMMVTGDAESEAYAEQISQFLS
jgi:uncharacterized protein (DUF362 family)